jgi:dipeptidyl aminopeptidase/acylaminoacyl peptidase
MKLTICTILASFSVLCGHTSAAEPKRASPPFYADKMNLLVWRDGGGESHAITDPADWPRRRKHILANMSLVMGPLPKRDDTPLDVQVVETERLEKVTRKKVTYLASKGDRVPAYLVIPHGIKRPRPAVLCLHGTGGPKGRTAGLGPDYPRYALELAERGYVTIAQIIRSLEKTKRTQHRSAM